ncbi:hypothetical protein, partial [Bosea sp. (in: a-proteobacteria)]|uniref:hypothetical protein n=1 Tax=Bosea sp. (in: a-proteobacteria) TaxID=1871050 RepID=UPI003B3B4F64
MATGTGQWFRNKLFICELSAVFRAFASRHLPAGNRDAATLCRQACHSRNKSAAHIARARHAATLLPSGTGCGQDRASIRSFESGGNTLKLLRYGAPGQ